MGFKYIAESCIIKYRLRHLYTNPRINVTQSILNALMNTDIKLVLHNQVMLTKNLLIFRLPKFVDACPIRNACHYGCKTYLVRNTQPQTI